MLLLVLILIRAGTLTSPLISWSVGVNVPQLPPKACNPESMSNSTPVGSSVGASLPYPQEKNSQENVRGLYRPAHSLVLPYISRSATRRRFVRLPSKNAMEISDFYHVLHLIPVYQERGETC